MSDSLHEYAKYKMLYKRLLHLIEGGMDESSEAETIREEMDTAWKILSNQQKQDFGAEAFLLHD